MVSTVFELWILVYRALEINWVMTGSVREELWVWEYLRSMCLFAGMIPLTISWTVSKERNRTCDGVDKQKVLIS